MNYDKIGRNRSLWCGGGTKGGGGVRLHPRRFSVSRLRKNFIFLFGVLRRWRNSYKKALRQLRGELARTSRASPRKNVNSRVGFGYSSGSNYYSGRAVRTMAHSNSFCSEAIADCLEFIKRNSVSADDETTPILLNQR
ncbi:Unknown protein [Striga hermonthica]|uniref:Uncharacterized protein n=1 Tax=Striga hermonthica TaxID=68872 RepID=A0A9N7NC60_STRHE|nr:Unknown protein [Striga hermonthica]